MMTNKEKYRRAFGVLHASDDFLTEAKAMKTRKFTVRKAVILCAAAVLILGMATVGYAENVGGIRRTIQLWIHGDQTDAVMDIENGNYTLSYEDAQGRHELGGGGVAIDNFGNERPLTDEELLEEINSNVDVEYKDDGTVWIYYQDQAMEITDLFDENNICYVQIKAGTGTLYVTVKYGGSFSYSSDGYVQPESFSD